jgi:hypothetical protein
MRRCNGWREGIIQRICMPRKTKAARYFYLAAFYLEMEISLFQLDLFVFHMLASFGIKFHDQHFLGHGFLVFRGRVEVTGVGCGLQLDFFASAFACHGSYSLSLATCAQVCEHSINAVFVDQAQCSVGHAQTHPLVFALDEKAAIVQIR